jgi:tRNA pseudouridine38-40 synthase
LYGKTGNVRYFITLSFDGRAYHGWQMQPNGTSVQEVVNRALSTLLREDICVTGAGRTDAGVHARTMVAHFDSDTEVDCGQLVYKLNKLLPRDIAVREAAPVADDMHARFSATARTYHYYVHSFKDAFLEGRSWMVTFPLDFERMNEAAAVLSEYEDFTSFSKVDTDAKTNLCRITEARWNRVNFAGTDTAPVWCFTVTANRFLRNMVRAIVGTLVEVGRGRMTVDEFRRVIERRDRCQAGESVPACGLYLWDIRYDRP